MLIANFSELIGKTFKDVYRTENGNDDDEIRFRLDDDSEYVMYHVQDCCESVCIDDISGTLEDLIGSPIIRAYESSNQEEVDYGSETWTFYTIATVNGWVTIRWFGSSNGYYSESTSLYKR